MTLPMLTCCEEQRNRDAVLEPAIRFGKPNAATPGWLHGVAKVTESGYLLFNCLLCEQPIYATTIINNGRYDLQFKDSDKGAKLKGRAALCKACVSSWNHGRSA